MTINSTIRKAGPFIGNGGTTVFPFAFKVFTAADLWVVKLTVSTNVQATLVLTTDYTVVLNQDQDSNPGGSATLVAGPLASGYTLTMTSDVADLQPTDLTNQGGFYPDVINDSLDRATIQIQQVQEEVDRSMRLPLSSTADTELPNPDANQLIGWNSTGDGLANIDPATLASIVAYATAYADTFTGNGSTVNWVLSHNPGVLFNLDVSINGVTQVPTTDYTFVGTTFTTTTAAPLAAIILVKYREALPNYSGDSQDIRYLAPLSGSVATNVEAKLAQTVSVKDFGAVGDGNVTADTGTDNSAAFNLALTYASSIGAGAVYIPNGSYKLNTVITIPQGVTLRGSGRHCTTLFAPASFNTTGGIIAFGAGTMAHGLCDLALLAPPGGVVGTGTSGVGIYANRNGTFIERVWVAGYNINILLANTDIFVLDSVIEECTASGIGIDMNASANDITIANCEVFACANTSIRIKDTLNTDGTINISNVRMLDVRTTGIQIIDSAVPVQISNCSAAGLSATTNVTGAGIAVDNSDNVAISNFVCRVGSGAKSTTGVGILISNTSTNVTIVGGEIQAMLDGIQSVGTNELVITGINCSSNGRRGIYINGGGRTTVTGVHCYGNGTAGGTTDAGIFDTNNTSNAEHLFTGCHCSQDGGGVQDYGFFIDIGASSCITYLSGCMAVNNNTADFSKNGVIANISRLDATINVSGSITANGGTAIPIGGTLQTGLLVSNTANFGVFFGSGAPSIAAAKGSLYLRSDGTSVGDRAYIATNASGTWTAITTVA